MRRVGAIAVIWAGCQAPPPIPSAAIDTPAVHISAPPPLGMHTGKAMLRGEPNWVQVWSAPAGAILEVMIDDALEDPAATCPPSLQGDCLGLGANAFHSERVRATPEGTALIELRIHKNLQRDAYIQVWSPTHAAWSELVHVPILQPKEDDDNDGLSNQREVRDFDADPLLPDTDGDGLDDLYEVDHGSSPTLADTNGDGQTDGEDVAKGFHPGSFDLDGDGLSNAEEAELGTDPQRVDTDGDGLNDRTETQRGTSPLVADTDADGLPDGTEVSLGTNPLLADTDEDGLLDGEELELGTLPRAADSDADGLSDSEELALGTSPLLADTDEDGLHDGDELALGTLPLVPDTDGDGLLDGDEVAWRSNPLVTDTDGDGLLDGDEAASHSNPLVADTDGDGLSDGDEVHVLFTRPDLADTDGGGQDDGAERQLDGDPLDASDDTTTCPGAMVRDCAQICILPHPTACDARRACAATNLDDAQCPEPVRVIPTNVSIPSTHTVHDLLDVAKIAGTLTIEPEVSGTVVLGGITEVGGLAITRDDRTAALSLSMPALLKTDTIEIHAARAPLTHLSLPVLSEASRVSMKLRDTTVSLPMLSSVDELVAYLNRSGRIAIDALQTTGRLDLAVSGTAEIALPSLFGVAHDTTLLQVEDGTLSLPTLSYVSDLAASSSRPGVLRFPSLVHARTMLVVHHQVVSPWPLLAARPPLDEGFVTTIEAPELTQLEHLVVGYLPALHTIELPKLTAPSLATLEVQHTPSLTALPTGWLEDLLSAKLVLIHTALSEAPLSSLRTARGLFIDDNPQLTTFSAPLLTNISGTLSVQRNARLTEVAVPALSALGNLGTTISSNPLLNTLDLSGVTDLGGTQPEHVVIENNPSLSDCELLEWATPFGDVVSLVDNGPC